MTQTALRTSTAIDYDVPVPMRDGTDLYADVYRPAGAGRYPVILVRTPFDRNALAPVHQPWFDLLGFVRAGYAVVVQSVRGTGADDASWRPFVTDDVDGADSVEWAAAQEWSDGNVGMAGKSSHAVHQLLAAAAAPRALRAIAPISTESHLYEGFTRQGGAFQLGQVLPSLAGVALVQLQRGGADEESSAREQLEAILADPWSAYRRRPLLEIAGITSWLDATYGEWLRHPDRDDSWRPTAISERYGTVRTPALHITGWHDTILKGTLDLYQGLRSSAATEEARANQRLIVAPWAHTVQSDVVGDLWYGSAASPASAGFHAVHLEWFDAWLKGERLPERDPVRLFVMGANRWRDETAWPLARAVATRWFLHTDGGLSPIPPGEGPPAEFVYDPRQPVPTVGGQSILAGGVAQFVGPRDRRAVQARPDVLVYTSDVLQDDVEVTGPVTVTLHVASSALDTDFTAALVDIHPDGRAIGVTDGILRLRYRNVFDHAELLEPGRVYEIEIDLTATSNVFLAGHRIAVEVSSSNFPRFDRNPNTGGTIAEARESDLEVARQSVFHDADRASFVTLPVVPA